MITPFLHTQKQYKHRWPASAALGDRAGEAQHFTTPVSALFPSHLHVLHPYLAGKGGLSFSIMRQVMLSEIHTSRQERRQGREVSWTTRGGGPWRKGLGAPSQGGHGTDASLVNRAPGAVPPLLERSGLLCHWACPLCSARCHGLNNRVRVTEVNSPGQFLALRAGRPS